MLFVGLCVALCTGASVLAQTTAVITDASAPASGMSNPKAVKAANRALRTTVMRKLSRTRGLNADGINVVASSGIVTLMGTVPDSRQIDLATDATRDVGGVREVKNSLTLQANGK
jgi:osmotically-inducible protein OsmY